MTIQFEFTPEIQASLNYERYLHPMQLMQRRMDVPWLKSHDLPHALIATLARCIGEYHAGVFAAVRRRWSDAVKSLLVSP